MSYRYACAFVLFVLGSTANAALNVTLTPVGDLSTGTSMLTVTGTAPFSTGGNLGGFTSGAFSADDAFIANSSNQAAFVFDPVNVLSTPWSGASVQILNFEFQRGGFSVFRSNFFVFIHPTPIAAGETITTFTANLDASFGDLGVASGDSGIWVTDSGGSTLVSWNAIPEPASALLVGLGALVLVSIRRERR
ncbi:MAG: PEP-CTERM sorting domain-containing protein [Verrucomicrobiota bacterium]